MPTSAAECIHYLVVDKDYQRMYNKEFRTTWVDIVYALVSGTAVCEMIGANIN